MTVYVGTSGFYYKEWVGPVYPSGTQTSSMLEIYSSMFHALEINSTYYRPPGPRMFANYPSRTREQTKLVVKLHSSFTHERNADQSASIGFREAIKPVSESGQFAGFLAQFPQSFHNSKNSRDYISRIRSLFPDDQLIMEFRHESFWDADILKLLNQMEISMCTVDLPSIPSLPPTGPTYTSDPAYIRLHGKNESGWYNGADERYTYNYSTDELEGILVKLKKILKKAGDIFVFFNNHPHGNAAINANEFIDILRNALPDALPAPLKDTSEDQSQLDMF